VTFPRIDAEAARVIADSSALATENSKKRLRIGNRRPRTHEKEFVKVRLPELPTLRIPQESAPMRHRIRIQSYISPEADRKFRALATARRLTGSAVADTAISQYCDDGRVKEALVVRRLDALAQAVNLEERRPESVASEKFVTFVQKQATADPNPRERRRGQRIPTAPGADDKARHQPPRGVDTTSANHRTARRGVNGSNLDHEKKVRGPNGLPRGLGGGAWELDKESSTESLEMLVGRGLGESTRRFGAAFVTSPPVIRRYAKGDCPRDDRSGIRRQIDGARQIGRQKFVNSR